MSFRVHVKTEFEKRDLREILQSSPTVLLGVPESADAQALFTTLGVDTVYDLAYAEVFTDAASVVRAAADPSSVFGQHGSMTSDLIDSAAWVRPIDELPPLSTSVLASVSAAMATKLDDILGAKSIRDLALWPPFLAAQKLVVEAYSPEKRLGYDPDAPYELIPRSGEFATQRVKYTNTVLIKSHVKKNIEWAGGPIDITVLSESGFDDVAFGAILSFSQTWSPKAVALGQLLHSLPLAPGESTRLTVVDWARRVRASTDEEIAQSEQLASAMNQSTAISEVTSSVAREFQSGASFTGAIGGSSSGSTGGVLGLIGIDASVGMSGGVAGTYTTTSGTRSVVATAQQNIASHTQQNSSLVRSKRASIVTEVSESDSENINTRVVVNNNHMHAMSIQYYEVVQTYETEVTLDLIERCLMLPMKLINFRNEQNLRRYLPILVRAALDRTTRDLLRRFGHTAVVEFAIDRFATQALSQLGADIAIMRNAAFDPATMLLPPGAERLIEHDLLMQSVDLMRRSSMSDADLGQRRGVIESFDRAGLKSFDFDRTAIIKNVSWIAGGGIKYVTLHDTDNDIKTLDTPGNRGISPPPTNTALGAGIELGRLASISVFMEPKANASPHEYVVIPLYVLVELRGRTQWLQLSFVTSAASSGEMMLLQVHSPVDIEDIGDRLMNEQLYYSQQIWRRADRQALIMQLANCYYQFPDGEKVRVIDYLDPTPVTVAGNYLAFRFTYESDAEWKKWKVEAMRDAKPRFDLVPLPTGGVFAEAVLSECNAAEKLDATRFWKWQESPIPPGNMAPQIADVQQGQHTRINAPTPGTLPDPGIKLEAIPSLPALDGSSAMLKAIAVSNMFRDMSGSEITSGLLKASIEAAKNGDVAAIKQANDTLAAINKAFAKAMDSAMNAGSKLTDTAKGLGSLVNMAGGSGGGGGMGALNGAMDVANLIGGGGDAAAGGEAAGAAAGGADIITAMGTEIGPVVEGLAGAIALV